MRCRGPASTARPPHAFDNLCPEVTRLLTFTGATRVDPAVEQWFDHTRESPQRALRAIARRWFEAMRACGADVEVLLHDGHPTACVSEAAFGYVNAFTSHVNVGFFQGAVLADPAGLLQGSGKFMRHVKLRPEEPLDATAEAALKAMIRAAYDGIRESLAAARRR